MRIFYSLLKAVIQPEIILMQIYAFLLFESDVFV